MWSTFWWCEQNYDGVIQKIDGVNNFFTVWSNGNGVMKRYFGVNKSPFFGNCVITPYGVITSHVFSWWAMTPDVGGTHLLELVSGPCGWSRYCEINTTKYKVSVGLVAAKASALRINLNIQACSIVAPPLHAPSRAPLLLPLLLSHNIPLPRVH